MSDDARWFDSCLRPIIPFVDVVVCSADGGDFDFDQDFMLTDSRSFSLNLLDTRCRPNFRECFQSVRDVYQVMNLYVLLGIATGKTIILKRAD